MNKITLPHPTPRMDAAWKRRGGTAMFDEGCALERENQTLRNAQKSCADCDSVFTVGQFKELKRENATLRAQKEVILEVKKEFDFSAAFPGFMRERIERAIDEALHPKGASTHSGMAKVHVADIQRLLLIIDKISE